MTEFDMKTASSLLPVMTGEEECTKKLIDALEFYSQNIKKEHESLLISFVLKTRISRHAKLRLASNYDTSADLIKDMKNNLLTKQSATALQLELLQSRQGSQSIEEFGKKLEDLFVELTISQADGKEDAYKMFRPVNEKLAIQRFTEGLRNGRLSTILTARDYSELKDVIRAAKDEERAHQGHSTSAETVFAAQHRGRHRNRLRGIRYLLGLITEDAQEVLLTIREDVDQIRNVVVELKEEMKNIKKVTDNLSDDLFKVKEEVKELKYNIAMSQSKIESVENNILQTKSTQNGQSPFDVQQNLMLEFKDRCEREKNIIIAAWSYRVHHLEANEVVPMLRRVLQGYEIPNYAEVRLRKSRHRFQPVGKSMFVKRIIPHGYKTGEYEYDSRLNTVFKPLFRYHVGTTTTEHEMSMVKGMKPVQKIPNTNSDLIVLTKINHKGHLLPEITKYVQQKSKWKKTKKRFKSYLNNLNVKDKIKQLRFLERSGEMNDPFAPGNIPENYLPHQPKTTEPPSPKRIIPDNPFWNYWTVSKGRGKGRKSPIRLEQAW
ncbi:unnamed protein product [Spodoptera exigua]|nr:unnamed protein product [Spodoptera exigua]